MLRLGLAILFAFGLGAPAAAQNTAVALAEVLGSWQGDDQAQFIELVLLADGQNQLASGAGLLIFDEAGNEDTVRTFRFQLPNPPVATAGARVLIATTRLAQLAGVAADYVLEPGVLRPDGGRVCYFTPSSSDCVAYGSFRGDNGPFGPRTRLTPDNRSLERIQRGGDNRTDWNTLLSPTPQNNAGQVGTMNTLCGNDELSQGEDCDGDRLGGATCASLGFVRGRLRCDECHFVTSSCTLCGNDEIDKREQCDGTELGGKTCEAIGFAPGGRLACSKTCTIDTVPCGDTFFVPGGGPAATDCVGEWRVVNGTGRPQSNGKAQPGQRCRDGDSTCDGDAATGTCTWTVAVCLGRSDPRLARCQQRPVESWALVRPRLDQDPDLAGRLVAAVAAVGPATAVGATVTFTPTLDASEHCSGNVAVVVPAGHAVKLGARVAGAGGKPRDTDALKLVCRR